MAIIISTVLSNSNVISVTLQVLVYHFFSHQKNDVDKNNKDDHDNVFLFFSEFFQNRKQMIWTN